MAIFDDLFPSILGQRAFSLLMSVLGLATARA